MRQINDNLTPTEIPFWYVKKVKDASILADEGGYNLYQGEMNPKILDAFLEKFSSSKVLWEPFAGHTRPNWTIERCSQYGHCLVAYDIHPCDSRVIQADSTCTGPPEQVDGVLFHPPYFTTDPMSGYPNEIATCPTLLTYLRALDSAVQVTSDFLKVGGIVCLVGRSIHLFSEWINVDWYMTDIFLKRKFWLSSIIKSTPDVVVFLEKQ